jgi:hypothetical protein
VGRPDVTAGRRMDKPIDVVIKRAIQEDEAA